VGVYTEQYVNGMETDKQNQPLEQKQTTKERIIIIIKAYCYHATVLHYNNEHNSLPPTYMIRYGRLSWRSRHGVLKS